MNHATAAVRPAGPPVPLWEQTYPGRLQWELDWLNYFKANPRIDQERLAKGALRIDLEWTVEGNRVELQADFPDSYPHIRPQVRLKTIPASYQRHISPGDGTICLIGREARQWTPNLGLARLLDQQLENALTGKGDEDPQAEPSEYWWNCCAEPGSNSFFLVDSGWDLTGHDHGFLEVHYIAPKGMRDFRAIVRRVLDASGVEIAGWVGMVPPEFANASTLRIPWARSPKVIAPLPNLPDLQPLLAAGGIFPHAKHGGTKLSNGMVSALYCVIHPTELVAGTTGDGWLFARVDNGLLRIIPVMRGGPQDIGARVPAVRHLREKAVGIVGLGAVGSPLALELARNGCRELRLFEHDRVEPGNSIRWPLGASAWGKRKVEALAAFIASEYGWCQPVVFPHMLGDVSAEGAEADALARFFDGLDLVIDATANFGVTSLLAEHCERRGLPLVTLWATPPVSGGVVALFKPASGCPNCLEHAHHDGTIAAPLGYGDEAGLQQPLACSERTFTGSSIDLQELSLEAARLVVAELAGEGLQSVVETLAFVDGEGRRIAPLWRTDPLHKHAGCTCNQ